MTTFRLILTFLRTNRVHALLVTLLLIATTAIMTASLIVGDSVKTSLTRITSHRWGRIQGMVQSTRPLPRSLAEAIPGQVGPRFAWPALVVDAICYASTSEKPPIPIRVMGVPHNFWDADTTQNWPYMQPNDAIPSPRLTAMLGLKSGSPIQVRLQGEDRVATHPLTITRLAGPSRLARCTPYGELAPTPTLFVSLPWLDARTPLSGMTHLLLFGSLRDEVFPLQTAPLNRAIETALTPEAFGLRITPGEEGMISVTATFTSVHLDQAVAVAAGKSGRTPPPPSLTPRTQWSCPPDLSLPLESIPPASEFSDALLDELQRSPLAITGLSLQESAEHVGRGCVNVTGLLLLGHLLSLLGLLLFGLQLIRASIQRRRGTVDLLTHLGYTRDQIAGLYIRETLACTLLAILPGLLLGWAYADVILQELTRELAAVGTPAPLTLDVRAVTLLLGALWTLVAGIILGVRSSSVLPRLPKTIFDKEKGPQPKRILARVAPLFVLILGIVVGTLAVLYGPSISLSIAPAALVFLLSLLVLVWIGRAPKKTNAPEDRSWSSLARLRLHPARSRWTIAITAALTAALLLLFLQLTPHPSAPAMLQSYQTHFPVPEDVIAPVIPTVTEPTNPPIHPIRVIQGDPLSRADLLRPLRPTLAGVDLSFINWQPSAYVFEDSLPSALFRGNAWGLLTLDNGRDEIPFITDTITARWVLHRKPGQAIRLTSPSGAPLVYRLVATVKDSPLPGAFLVWDTHLDRLGLARTYRHFLIDNAYLLASSQTETNHPAAPFFRAVAPFGLEMTEIPPKFMSSLISQRLTLMLLRLWLLGSLGFVLTCILLPLRDARDEAASSYASDTPSPHVSRSSRSFFLTSAVRLVTGFLLGLALAFALAPTASLANFRLISLSNGLLLPVGALIFSLFATTLGAALTPRLFLHSRPQSARPLSPDEETLI